MSASPVKCPIFLAFGSLALAVTAESVTPGSGTLIGSTCGWLSGILGTRVQSWVNTLFPKPQPGTEEIFRNHDILKLLQSAIMHAAEKTCDLHHGNGYANDRLRDAGPLLAKELAKSIEDPGHPLAVLREFDITALLGDFVKNEGKITLLTEADWLPAIALLPDLEESERKILAAGMARHFGESLWGCTKHNAAGDRKAFAAIELIYLSEIKKLLLDRKETAPPEIDLTALDARFATLLDKIEQRHRPYFESILTAIAASEGKILAAIEKTQTREGARAVIIREITAKTAALTAALDPAADWKLIQSYEEDRDIQIAAIDRVLDNIDATIAKGQASRIYLTASDILTTKGPGEALAFLESKAPARGKQIATALALRERETHHLRTLLQEDLLTATVLTQQFRYAEAEEILLRVLSQDDSWPQARHEYIVYLIWTKGSRQQTHETLAAALSTYREAERQSRLLTLQEPENTQWQRDLSVSHNKLGDIARAQGALPAAAKAYTAALEIAQALAARDPENTQWQRDLSISHDRLGDIAVAQGDLPAAAKAYTAGLEIRQALAARDPENTQWQRDLFISNSKLGDVAVAQGDLPAAAKAYTAALEICQALAARDPENTQWQRDLSVSHERLGDVAVAQSDLPAAATAYTAGLEIRQALAARDPENTEWQRDLFVSHYRLADVAEEAGDAAGARVEYRKSHDILQAIADKGKHVSPQDMEVLDWLKKKLADD